DRDRRVQQGHRQAEVLDDRHAGRLERGLLLVVEEPGEQAPVEHLPAPRVAGRLVFHRRRLGGHRRSNLPARSLSTETASPVALATFGSVGPMAQSAVRTVTFFFFTVVCTAMGCSRQAPPFQRSRPRQADEAATWAGVSGPA